MPPDSENKPKTSETLSPVVRELEEIIAESGDRLIPLAKRTQRDEPLHLLVLRRDFQPDPGDIEDYQKFGGIPPADSMSFQYVFAEQSNGMKPIGRYCWTIGQGQATGGGGIPDDQRNLLKYRADNPLIRQAMKELEHSSYFHVKKEYRRQNIGAFLIAASLASLDLNGAVGVDLVTLLTPSANLWRKWGIAKYLIERENFVIPDTQGASVQSLLMQPLTEQVIKEFLHSGRLATS